MTDPTKDPQFSGVKQPVFDNLVSNQSKAVGLLDQLAHDLWAQLNVIGVDTSPALRIRALAGRMGERLLDLRVRQTRVHAMERDSRNARLSTPTGTFWKLPGAPRHRPEQGMADLSVELDDAELLTPPAEDPDGTRFSRDEDAVLSWIELHRDEILREAKKWNIPPTAIASAIAWEALKNKWSFFNPVPPGWPHGKRWFGPGKVHTTSPLATQVENRGYLPKVSVEQRGHILSTADGSIRYIAAEMAAFADVTEQDGRFPSIRNNIAMLTWLYNGHDLDDWKKKLDAKDPSTPFAPEGDMSGWIQKHPEFVSAMDHSLHGTHTPKEIEIPDPPMDPY
ncbi:MAG: hypothetical protein ACJ72N_04720 [Labedaea sp.]